MMLRNGFMAATALTLASVAAAQTPSGVQLYGTLSAGLVHKTNQTGASNTLDNSPLSYSLIGVRGNEDLGGGLGAVFRLESGITPDNGGGGATVGGAAKFWNRQSFVGLNIGQAATVTFGRQFHAGTDRVVQSLDTYNVAGSTLHVAPLALFGVHRFAGNDNRVDDSLKLRLRGPAGLTGGVSVGMDDGTGRSYSLDLAQVTPGYVIAAWWTRYRSPTEVTRTGERPEHDSWGVGGNALVGPVRLYLHFIDASLDSATQPAAPAPLRVAQKNRIVHLGAVWQAQAATTIKAAYYHDRGRDLNGVTGRDGVKSTWVLSAEYALSRRTSLNAAVFSNRFTDGYRLDPVNLAALGRDPNASTVQGYTVGLRHDF